MAVYENLLKKGTSEIVYPNIKTPNIPDSGVTTAKIADNAVTTAKLVDYAVTTDKVGYNQIDNQHLKLNCIATNNIRDYAVTNDKIADQTITADKLAYQTIDNPRLAPNCVTSNNIWSVSNRLSTYLTGVTTIAEAYTKIRSLINQPWISFYSYYGNGGATINFAVFVLAGAYKISYNGLTTLAVQTMETDSDIVNFITNAAPDIYFRYMQ